MASCSKRHPVYHGIRWRGGKWVSEIREPGKASRIWLGTFARAEMAAAAYDVAALALKGKDNAVLNLPESVGRYPVPLSNSPSHIRSAAIAAASLFNDDDQSNVVDDNSNNNNNDDDDRNMSSASSSTSLSLKIDEFVDEDAIFCMPSLLVEMAEGMLLSPPRITSPHSSDYSHVECLWRY